MIRRGISIIEVLFSIGVIAIGLLGVISVVPVALRQVGQGQTADAASRVGANAMREFDALGMARARPGTDPTIGAQRNMLLWRRPTANDPTSWAATRFIHVNWSRGPDGAWGTVNSNDDSFLVQDDPLEAGLGDDVARNDGFPMNNVSYALDPRFIAAADTSNLQPDMRSRSVFPRFDTTDPGGTLRMVRVTLPGVQTFGLGSGMGGMSIDQANKFFMIEDDLLFDIPDVAEDPPSQVFLWTPGPDGEWGIANTDDDGNGNTDDQEERGWEGSDDIPLTREFEGNYSWMATLVPKPYLPGQTDGEYNLSIVVCNRRSLDLASETVAQISNANSAGVGFLGQGIGGGDVIIESLPLASRPQAQADIEALRPGQWVLLGGTLLNAITGLGESTFRWYRVVNVGDGTEYNATTDCFEIDATLNGPDWPASSLVPGSATQVVMMNSVVAVYERNIRIQTE